MTPQDLTGWDLLGMAAVVQWAVYDLCLIPTAHDAIEGWIQTHVFGWRSPG